MADTKESLIARFMDGIPNVGFTKRMREILSTFNADTLRSMLAEAQGRGTNAKKEMVLGLSPLDKKVTKPVSSVGQSPLDKKVTTPVSKDKSTTPSSPSRDRTLKNRRPADKSYKIKAGDTLSAISKKSGVSLEKLMKLNNIKDANKIRAGANLKLPSTANVLGPSPLDKKVTSNKKYNLNSKGIVTKEMLNKFKKDKTMQKKHGESLTLRDYMNEVSGKKRVKKNMGGMLSSTPNKDKNITSATGLTGMNKGGMNTGIKRAKPIPYNKGGMMDMRNTGMFYGGGMARKR